MALENIKNIAVVGSGLMGHGIGLTYALAGYNVCLNDTTDQILDNALHHVEKNLEMFAENGLIEKDDIRKAMALITTSSDLEKAVCGADFVTEAIVEDVETKKNLFQRLDSLCPPHTIVASNTSSLLISEFGAGTRREDRQLITHWFNPPHIVPVVEVVRGPKTSDQTVDTACALLKRARKFPVKVLREIPGFLVNRVQAAAIREVWSLWEQGIASVEDIDLAVRGSFGFRLASLGPLQICDLGGVDLWHRVNKNLLKDISSSTEVCPAVGEMVARGDLGIKTGKGFYNYSTDYFKADWDGVVKKRDREFIQRLRDLYWKE